ncbi:hypothetical protein K440DRAFT_235641 [Wilcoxina mikolae CBS 423.85]|nr:hypothetical protein K440DRAFT_235641 [Wilcoxina mikolae CBS 423.85]
MDLKKGIISINNRDRLILGTAGAEIPMAPAARDYRTMRDYVRAGAPILPPPPAQLSRISVPLPSPEQFTVSARGYRALRAASPKTNSPPATSSKKSTNA